jgi:hypothetical protein
MKAYDDIINLPHHVSAAHPHMPVADRAAQFAPFAALTGYDAAVKEAARLTDKRIELDEYEKEALSEKLQLIAERIDECSAITIIYFQPDHKKDGGAYVALTGCMKKIDEYEHVVVMMDGTKVSIEEILAIESESNQW